MAGRRMTRREKQEALALKAQGLSNRVIGQRLGRDQKTIMAAVKSASGDPLMRMAAAERAGKLMGVPKEELRREQKHVFMAHFRGMTEEMCDFMLEAIQNRDAAAFRDVAAGMERVDKMSGNAVGEAQQVAAAQAPQITIDLGRLIEQVQGRAPKAIEA